MVRYRLPIFPLPLVLFPGSAQGLHIFEPRYRQLLADCQADDGRFGISPVAEEFKLPPRPGSIGCTASIREVATLPDGRSNIVVGGGARYAIDGYVDTDRMYLLAEVHDVDDEPWFDHAVMAELAADVRERYLDYLAAMGQVWEGIPGAAPPDDPGGLSYTVSAALELGLELKIRLLELQSTSQRLELLREVLGPLTSAARERGVLHQQARRNGRRRLEASPGEEHA